MSERPFRRSPRLTVFRELRQLCPRASCPLIGVDSGRAFGGGICAASESFSIRIASFAGIAKPEFDFRLEFSARNRENGRCPQPLAHQFDADPCTDPTGARNPLGGSVSHSRSGSGPSGTVFPIPNQFNGLRLPSVLDDDPQEPPHFTVCPSGVTARTVTGSFAGNGCV